MRRKEDGKELRNDKVKTIRERINIGEGVERWYKKVSTNIPCEFRWEFLWPEHHLIFIKDSFKLLPTGWLYKSTPKEKRKSFPEINSLLE